MFAYALRRLVLAIPLLIGITFISFLVIHLAPGEPVENLRGRAAPSPTRGRERLRELYGLDKPLHVQYWNWVTRLARLDFGRSFRRTAGRCSRRSGSDCPITLLLNLVEMMIIVALAVPDRRAVGDAAVLHFDKVTTVFVFVGFATPDFWLALMLMILFGVQLGWLPISGLRSLNWEYLAFWRQQWDFVGHLDPADRGGHVRRARRLLALHAAVMLEVVRQDYIQSARAKGLAERVVIGKHALRNALLPIVTILGLSLPGLIGGSVIIESIFAIPGMGQLMVQAVFERDYPVIMGNLVIVATLTLVANLVADIAYSLVDPRIRWAAAAPVTAASQAVAERVREFWRTFSRNRLAADGGASWSFSSALALLAPVLAPWDPNRPDTRKILLRAVDEPTGSAPTSSAATCSRGCSTARGSRSRWASCRSGSRPSSASCSARRPATTAA